MRRDAMMRKCRRSDRGVVAVVVAVALVGLLIVGAIVLEFGVARANRQVNKSATDSAVLAGLNGMDVGDGVSHPYAAVCAALRYLKAESPRFGDITGTWSRGDGPGTGDGCSTLALTNTKCVSAANMESTWARFTGTASGGTITVKIQSGYRVNDGTFSDDSLPNPASDNGSVDAFGCDQLGIVVTQTQPSALGKSAGRQDITTTVRSVGRRTTGSNGMNPVALLLTEQTRCNVISGSPNGGVAVRGFGDTAGQIHTDSDGSGCSSNQSIFSGNNVNGIVAYGSPTTPSKVGTISSVAGLSSTFPITHTSSAPAIRDDVNNVYGSAATPSTKYPPVGRTKVTRSPVDDAYLTGITNLRDSANTIFAYSSSNLPPGYTLINTCSPSAAQSALTGSVWVHCSDLGTATLQAKNIVVDGTITATNVQFPQAEKVYVFGAAGTGITVTSLKVHTQGATTCPSGQQTTYAHMVLRSGQLKQSNSNASLQMCNTALLLMGGATNAYLPGTSGTAPTTNASDGLFQFTGGSLDWTAPNTSDSLVDQTTHTTKLEDLALWSEASAASNISGGGTIHLSGVFMLPNADAFNIKGGGTQDVADSQYVARRLTLTGNGLLSMAPNPANVVGIPSLGDFQLVR